MKIVVLDGYTTNPGDLSWEFLQQFGDYTVYDRTPRAQTVERAREAEIVLTNKVVLDREILSQLPELRFIELLSTGYNVIDCDYARERGIPVSNIPAYSTDAVAQLVFAFILAFCNAVPQHNAAVQAGEWVNCPDFCFWKTNLTELSGKTLGIIGFGRIGRRVAEIALAFGMRCLACTPHPKGLDLGPRFAWAPLDEVLVQSDFVTLHCPLTPQTEKMVNAAFLKKMKRSAYLINTSRGPVVDETALAQALNTGALAGAGVDVLSTEPPRPDNPLLAAQNCLITPHIAWAGLETRERLLRICEENLRAFCNGEAIHVVNP
ncbi:MAG TPA: D-2-hydroxyacid dehydrogenase [Candidatus Fimivicinus intestinavium]|nr:D-2-hydroxyacid dehydrogenase [Candidatus Fimivicinus intestinavium]